ncbi:MAG TPA: hypothetical protein ENJ82_09950, partial [Bacteroidetes bacterium]|nr:hypothetical protein [Bacteroidota bacterium]
MKKKTITSRLAQNSNQNEGKNAESQFPSTLSYPILPPTPLRAYDAPTQLFRDPGYVKSAIMDSNAMLDEEGPGTMEGFGATVGDGADKKTWMTQVSWGALEGNSGEGTIMEAKPLGLDHPSGESSGHSDDKSKARAQFLSHITRQDYIQGHLLNDNMGGPADRRNLSAIPGKPGNSAHEKLVESPIKSLLDHGYWVYYKVEVDYQDVKLKALNPHIEDEQIEDLNGYDYLPGITPTKREDNIRIASRFKCEWYTYQANGRRDSAVKRVNILFPHKVQGNREANQSDYGTAQAGYSDRFIAFPNVSQAESTESENPAVVNDAVHLNLSMDLEDTDASSVPNYPPARLELIACERWQHEIENSVVDGKIKYPEYHQGELTWKAQGLAARYPRASNYMSYLEKCDKMKNWYAYKAYLIDKVKRDYK